MLKSGVVESSTVYIRVYNFVFVAEQPAHLSGGDEGTSYGLSRLQNIPQLLTKNTVALFGVDIS